jgi:uncharacterized protein (DUF697 family)
MLWPMLWPMLWKDIFELYVKHHRTEYAQSVRRSCESLGVRFLDLNHGSTPLAGDNNGFLSGKRSPLPATGAGANNAIRRRRGTINSQRRSAPGSRTRVTRKPMTTDAVESESGTTAADDATAVPMTPPERHAAADRLVRNYTLAAMAVGLVPIPLLDLAGVMAVQLKMLHGLAPLYDIEFRADLGRAAVASLIGGTLPAAAAPALAFSLSKIIPLSGQLLGAGSQTLLAGAATYAIGKVFIQHFAAGGTFLTFDPEVVRDYFEQQLEHGKHMAAELKRKAGRGGDGPGDGAAPPPGSA